MWGLGCRLSIYRSNFNITREQINGKSSYQITSWFFLGFIFLLSASLRLRLSLCVSVSSSLPTTPLFLRLTLPLISARLCFLTSTSDSLASTCFSSDHRKLSQSKQFTATLSVPEQNGRFQKSNFLSVLFSESKVNRGGRGSLHLRSVEFPTVSDDPSAWIIKTGACGAEETLTAGSWRKGHTYLMSHFGAVKNLGNVSVPRGEMWLDAPRCPSGFGVGSRSLQAAGV